jgi:hypothetical protein
MKLNRLAIVVGFAASLSGAAFAEEAQKTSLVPGVQPFHANIAGTCTNKDDFSFTATPVGLAPGGALRIHCVVAGNSTQGRYTAQILSELLVTATPCTAPGGVAGLLADAKGFVAVLSFVGTDDQLFLKLGSGGSECLTPPGVVAPGQATLLVTGGTGRYQRATGTLENVFSPIALAFSALEGDGFLSAYSGALDGFLARK